MIRPPSSDPANLGRASPSFTTRAPPTLLAHRLPCPVRSPRAPVHRRSLADQAVSASSIRSGRTSATAHARSSNTMLTDGLQGPGTFLFHNGIDIAAADGTPVYPRHLAGRSTTSTTRAISVQHEGHGVFQYFHHRRDRPAAGEQVIAGRTILGVRHARVRPCRIFRGSAGAVSGIPRARRHRALPRPDSSAGEGDQRAPGGRCCRSTRRPCAASVSIVAAADDARRRWRSRSLRELSARPAFLTWSLAKVGGSTYVRDVPRPTSAPRCRLRRAFWNVYARGSYQNAPRFSNRQYFMAGRFLYNLANGARHALVSERALRGDGAGQRHARKQLRGRAPVQDREPRRHRDRLRLRLPSSEP